MTYREIARQLYGDDDIKYIKRVDRLIRHAKKKTTRNPYRLSDENVQVIKDRLDLVKDLANHTDSVIDLKKKHGNNMALRQLFSHEQFMYYLLTRIGFPADSMIWSTAKYYHYKYFPLFYEKYTLKCWRNGGGKIPFSFNLESLSYVTGIIISVLYFYGYIHKRKELEDVIREILPSRKYKMIYQFYYVFAEVGGKVMGLILHPHI